MHEDLAVRYMPLAQMLARVHSLNRQEFDDTYSDALYGLVRASKRFDGKRPFSPYAQVWIRGAIQQGKRNRSGIRASHKHPRPQVISLELVDVPDESASDDLDSKELWRMVDALPDFEGVVVRLYYEQDLPQTVIAEMLDMNQMRVSRILSRARNHLRERIGA